MAGVAGAPAKVRKEIGICRAFGLFPVGTTRGLKEKHELFLPFTR